jgi:hypothetical protein
MKYLIAALPIATLVACGGGGGGGGTPAPSVQSGTATFDPTTGDTDITQNGTTYNFTGTSLTTISGTPSAQLRDSNGTINGVVFSSNDVTLAFGIENGSAPVFALSGTQTAPSQAQTGGSAIYRVEVSGANSNTPPTSGSNMAFHNIDLTADFGASTLTGGGPGSFVPFEFNGTIYNGTMVQGTIRNDASGPLTAGSGNFTGGFYGTDELAGIWTTTGTTSGDQMGGVFYGRQ